MKNQLSLKFEIFKQLYTLWNQDKNTIHQIGIKAGIKPFTMHQLVCGKPVCWRHYFKLLNYYGYDLEVKLIKKKDS
ncbi:MAG: hypothetical protein IJ545_03280 [Alphaproteobacteria bacterium]|nr:hypothetical protein [Alphaproteobacteria bacterium]